MFGGESTHRTALDDVWTYDIQSNEWSEVQADPHPVDADGRTAAYDAESDRIIVHFTTQLDRSGPNGLRRISETWAYDPASGSWADMRPDPAPFGLMGARMVYDAAADRMILFGGADFTKESWPMFNETWAYDFNSNTWSQRHPQSPPPGRSYFGMVYDAGAGRTLMFGGTMAAEDSASVDEMWAYDYGADRWERVDYTGSAPADHHPAMAYAAGLDRSFYLVGRSLHAFEYGTRSWTELAFDEALGVRYFSAMAYDEAGDRLVVFGGGPRGLRYDDQTWLYDPSSDQWQPGGPPD